MEEEVCLWSEQGLVAARRPTALLSFLSLECRVPVATRSRLKHDSCQQERRVGSLSPRTAHHNRPA